MSIKLKINQKIKMKEFTTGEIIEGVVSSVKNEDYSERYWIKSKKFTLSISHHNLNFNYDILKIN